MVFFLCKTGPCTRFAYAKNQGESFQNIFNNTLWGLATGAVISAAYTLTKSDPDNDTWRKNLGIGATIGAIGGFSYGLAIESGPNFKFRLSPSMRLYNSKDNSSEVGILLDCFHLYF